MSKDFDFVITSDYKVETKNIKYKNEHGSYFSGNIYTSKNIIKNKKYPVIALINPPKKIRDNENLKHFEKLEQSINIDNISEFEEIKNFDGDLMEFETDSLYSEAVELAQRGFVVLTFHESILPFEEFNQENKKIFISNLISILNYIKNISYIDIGTIGFLKLTLQTEQQIGKPLKERSNILFTTEKFFKILFSCILL